MEDLNKITSRRVKEALDDKVMIASELSRKTGLSRSAISQYINGTYIPVGRAAQLIGEVLGVNPKWLAGISDNKYAMEFTWKDHSKEPITFPHISLDRLLTDEEKKERELKLEKIINSSGNWSSNVFPESLSESVGERIRKAREKQNMSLIELSERAKLNYQLIQDYESNKEKTVPLLHISYIAKALNIPPYELSGFEYMHSDEDMGSCMVNEPIPHKNDVLTNNNIQPKIDKDEQELLDLWRVAPLKVKMQVYQILLNAN